MLRQSSILSISTKCKMLNQTGFVDVCLAKQKLSALTFYSLLARSGEFLVKLVSFICFILNAKTPST